MSPYALAAGMMIASGSIHAVVNAIIKGRRGADEVSIGRMPPSRLMAGRAATDGVSALLLLPGIALVPLPAGAWGWLATSALVHVVYLYAMIRAYALADFSAAYPVLRGTAPLVTAIVTIGVLGEPASMHTIAGIALIGAALFGLVLGRHLGRAAFGWSVLTGAMTAAYTVADAHGVRAAPSVASYIVWDFVLLGTVSIALFGAIGRGAVFAAMRVQWRASAAAGTLSVVTYGLAIAALSLGPTASLAALRETGMVTALLIATFWLGERITAKRVGVVLTILIGAALVIAR